MPKLSASIVLSESSPNPQKQLAERVRLARLAAQLTQKQLGDQVGVCRQMIGHIENTGNVMGVTLLAIARSTNQPLSFFELL